MKCYYYGSPSRGLVKTVFIIRNRAKWLRYPLALVLVLVWLALVPAAWVLTRLGEVGHAVTGWCGFESRQW